MFIARPATFAIAALLAAIFPVGIASAQEPPLAPPAAEGVTLNFPDNVELRLLVDYVSQRLGVKILYDEAINNKKITVKAPDKIPADSLLPLLESALKMKDLALVDSDVPGWKRIVKNDKLIKIARPELNPAIESVAPTEAITQAFTIRNTSPKALADIIKPFLTGDNANTLVLDKQNVLVVTDYASNLSKIKQLIETVDRAGPEATMDFYTAEHVGAPELQKQITSVLSARLGGAADQVLQAGKLQITSDARTNQMILVGPKEQVTEATQLARALDVPLGMRTEVYTFRFVEAARIDRLVQDLFDELTIKRLYRSALDEEDNLLIATTTNEIHAKIEWLRDRMDIEAKQPGSAVQFYRLKYADAVEVIQTIESIRSGGSFFDRFSPRGISPLGRGRWNDNRYSQPTGYQGRFVPGPNSPPITPGAVTPVRPPAVVEAPENEVGLLVQQGAQPSANAEQGVGGLLGGNAQVTADPTSNSIIVVADRATQAVYKNLIEYLDQRRPQVMIEAKVVILDTSDGYSLGVEVSTGDRMGIERLFEFTSFGLSMVDPASGALSLIPGRGLNWTLVDPDGADAVLRALSTHRRAKVVSSPRILVNDNATGTLASVAEVPFTSVNASDTVATTSFAGFAEAGTTIEVTPRISDDDHLELDYVVTLNSFTGDGGGGVPPPRQTDEIASSVTIPDGYTVIVGGLNRENISQSIDAVPFIENIPLLRLLTSVDTESNSRSTLFIFLRPVILRDDKFEDLKYMSDRDLKPAGIKRNYPVSCPVLVR